MELFVFRHSKFERLYNCSLLDVDQVPLERRRFVAEAWVIIILCAIYYLLYVPCLCSIWKRSAGSACYKLLLYIGMVDLSVLWIPGFLHGWLSLQGAVFCSHPTLIYWTGLLSLSLWIVESMADLILAINRCIEMAGPDMAKQLFDGWRMHIWTSMVALYALYWFLFIHPVLFSGLYFAWFFEPFVGYRDDQHGIFAVPLHNFHNLFVAVTSPLVYLIFTIIVFCKKLSSHRTISKTEKMVFLQIFILSAINTVTASLYVLMQHITPSQWIITLAQFTWLHIHGLPPVIYLCLNQTIRNDCKALFLSQANLP